MGGSLGLALRAHGLAETVTGFDARPDAGARALARGAIDVACTTVGDAIRDADLVMLAAPVLAERALLSALADTLRPDAVVTDLGSTKEQVCSWALDSLPHPARFIGGHPMAGREQSGIDAADATLYAGCVWCLTPSSLTAPEVTSRVSNLAVALGAVPLTLDAVVHDRLVAGASHLPLLAAVALVRTVAQGADWPDVSALAAGGFRDTTRVASGDPVMAGNICLTNGPAIVTRLDAYIAELLHLREQIVQADPEVEAEFREARAIRESWLRRQKVL